MAKKVSSKKPAPTPIRLPEDVKALLMEQAKKENRSLGNMIVTIIKKYFKIS